MKRLTGAICAALFTCIVLVQAGPAHSDTLAELQSKKKYAKLQYTTWVDRHRQILRKVEWSMNQRDRYKRGSKLWIDNNNEVNRLVPKLNHCRDAADYWAKQYSQIKSAIGKAQNGNKPSGQGYWNSWDNPGASTGGSGNTTGTGISGNSGKGLLMGEEVDD